MKIIFCDYIVGGFIISLIELTPISPEIIRKSMAMFIISGEIEVSKFAAVFEAKFGDALLLTLRTTFVVTSEPLMKTNMEIVSEINLNLCHTSF